MRKLYYSSCSFATPHMGVLLDSILDDKENGCEVHWAYCNRGLGLCQMNSHGFRTSCWLCQSEYNHLFKAYGKGIILHPIKRSNFHVQKFNYDSSSELKSIVYRKVFVGYAILSYYISATRNPQIQITDKTRDVFDDIISQVCGLIDQIYELIDIVQPNIISIYNGRLFENRMLYDIARALNIKFESYEIIGGINEPAYKVCFHEGLPHDTRLFAQNANRIWDISNASDKIQVAKSFFEKRRKGIPAADKVYIKKQISGMLPAQIKETADNIVIFNSSDDELAALGGEWEEGKLFASQYDAIDFLCKNSSNQIHYYLRIHPNLSNVHHSFVTSLYDLEKKYSNITVISPDSPISTYDLMDMADKVVVFGSTMGVESCYWGKPVILIGHAFYSHLNIAYQPRDLQEIVGLINNRELAPKQIDDALKYAYYILDRTYRTIPCKHININNKVVKVGKSQLSMASYLKLGHSNLLFKLVQLLLNYGINPMLKRKYSIEKIS